MEILDCISGIAAVLAALIAVLYAIAVHHNGYWHMRNVPGPPSCPFSGNMGTWFRRIPLPLQLREWTKQYGKTYGVQEGWLNVFVTSDLQLLHELFVTKFEYFHGRKLLATVGDIDRLPHVSVFKARGARWKRLRAISGPLLSVNNIKKAMPILHDSMRVMMSYFEKLGCNGTPIDIAIHFHELSTDVLMRVAMGQPVSRQFENVDRTRTISANFALGGRHNLHFYGRIVQPWASNIVHYASKYCKPSTNSAFASLLKFIKAEVSARRAERMIRKNASCPTDDEFARRADFIDLFLDAEDESAILSTSSNGKTFDKSVKVWLLSVWIAKQLSAEEISAQFFVFLAGSDTLANELAITCFYLARSDWAQRRMRTEIIEVCGADVEPTYEQINQLCYMDAVVKEALRLCPLAAVSCSRVCSKATTLGEYPIDEGTIVHADVFSVHRDKTIWGDYADEFRPERWLEDGAVSRAALSWLPFGLGPRVCIGMRLAYLEEKLALINILRAYSIHPAPGSKKQLTLRGNGVLSPGEINVVLKKIE